MTIRVLNNGTTAYPAIPVLVSMNNVQLNTQGYILSTGLDTNMQEGASDSSYMVDTILTGIGTGGFAGGQQRSYFYRMGNVPPQTSFPVIVGYNGSVEVVDSPTLELGNNFTYSTTGYIDTSLGTNKTPIYKAGAFEVIFGNGVAGNVTASILRPANIRIRFYNSDAVNTKVINLAGVRFVKPDGAFGFPNAFVDGGGWATETNAYDNNTATYATQTINALSWGAFLQLSNSGISSTAMDYYATAQAQINQVDIDLYDGISTWDDIFEGAIVINSWVQKGFTYPVVTATGITSGNHTVTVSANVTTLALSINGSLKDTVALGGVRVPNTSGNYTLMENNSMVYASNTTVSINGTQQLWFQPVIMPTDTALPDRSGNGHNGIITWGTNPTGIEITMGAITSSSSTTYGDGDGEEVLPIVVIMPDVPLYENTTERTDMPQYILMKAAADSLGWTTNTLYGYFMIGTAGVMFIAGLVATSVPIIAAAIGLALLGMAGSTGIIAPIIVGAIAVLIIALIVIVKRN